MNQDKCYRERISGRPWIGLNFTLGGVTIFLDQFNFLSFELNWWALFILLPALGALAVRTIDFGQPITCSRWVCTACFDRIVYGWSFIFFAYCISFNVNWNLYWLFIIILIGLSMILDRRKKNELSVNSIGQ